MALKTQTSLQFLFLYIEISVWSWKFGLKSWKSIGQNVYEPWYVSQSPKEPVSREGAQCVGMRSSTEGSLSASESALGRRADDQSGRALLLARTIAYRVSPVCCAAPCRRLPQMTPCLRSRLTGTRLSPPRQRVRHRMCVCAREDRKITLLKQFICISHTMLLFRVRTVMEHLEKSWNFKMVIPRPGKVTEKT